MKKDPIVAQVRKARAQIVRLCENNLSKLFKFLREEDKPTRHHVRRSNKRRATG
jgi:hypothetical protein